MGKKPRRHPKKEKRVADAIYDSEVKEMEKAFKDLTKEWETVNQKG